MKLGIVRFAEVNLTMPTTQSAISPANVTIGGKAATAEQLKDVATTANANSLANNFDVQKVQDQMALASTVGDVGALATNVVSTAMQRSEHVKRDEALKAAEDNLKATDPVAWQTYQAHPSAQALVDIEFNQALQTNPVLKAEYEALPKDKQDTFVQDQINQGKGFGVVSNAEAAWHQTQNQYGPGSDFSRTAQALSGLAAGLASGNNGQALSNLTQPFLASAIGTYFDKLEEDPVTHQIVHQADTTAERLLAHAAAGAVVAYFSGNNAASGATGAVSGEAMAIIVHQQMYDGKPTDQLTTAEKENIRAVTTLASGLAGALQGGSFETAATSAAAGYNAAVNNALGMKEGSWQDISYTVFKEGLSLAGIIYRPARIGSEVLDLTEIGYDLLAVHSFETLSSKAGTEIIVKAIETQHPSFRVLPSDQKAQTVEALKYLISKGIQGVITLKKEGLQ